MVHQEEYRLASTARQLGEELAKLKKENFIIYYDTIASIKREFGNEFYNKYLKFHETEIT